MLRRAGEDRGDLAAPPGELDARDAGIGDLVDDVVDFAAERVQRGDRAPARAAAGTESCSRSSSRSARPSAGNTRRASCGRQPARSGTSAQASATQSRRREHRPARGRRRRRRASMRVEDAQAAGDRPLQLEAERAAAARARAGVPASSSARVRAVSNAISARQRSSHAPSAICVSVDAEARQIVRRQVDAALAPVDRDVLPEVGELQPGADRVGLRRGSPASSTPYRCSSRRPTGLAERAAVVERARRSWRSASLTTSWRNADSRSRSRRERQRDARGSRAASAANGGVGGRLAAVDASSIALEAIERREARRPAARRLRRRCRRRARAKR